jgi:hypothetical protein
MPVNGGKTPKPTEVKRLLQAGIVDRTLRCHLIDRCDPVSHASGLHTERPENSVFRNAERPLQQSLCPARSLIDRAIEYEKIEAIREVSAAALLPIVFLEERRYASGCQRANLVNVYRSSVEVR